MNFDDLVVEKAIDICGKHLRDEDLDVVIEVLRKSKVLERLVLGGNHLTLADGKFTDALAHNNTLTYLRFDGNKIGDEGSKRLADALKVNSTLKQLYLGSNQIGDEGAKHFADALMENESLELIILSWNKIGDDGAKSFANCFTVNQSIREVYLRLNNISKIGAQKLFEALKWNDSIKDFEIGGNLVGEYVKTDIYELLNDPKRKVRRLMLEIQRKDKSLKHLREENTSLKTALASAEAKLKSIQDEKDDNVENSSLNDTRNIKVKQEADMKQETDIDTDDDEMGSPEKKKQKTEKA